MTPEKVANNVVVILQYQLRVDDGELVEESEQDDPLVYLHGHENIIPGLERELEGLRVGDRKKVVVEPEDGYGDYDEDDIGSLNMDEIPPDFLPEVGMVLPILDEDGNEGEALVLEVHDDEIVLDFNHPLSGERLHFDVEITGLRQPTSDELAHGHVHEDEDHEH